MVRFSTLLWLLESASAVASAATSQWPPTPFPTIEGPITGGSHGHPFSTFAGNISVLGYVEEEYFLSNTATRYNVVGNLTFDGHWTLSFNSTANYKTRILVRRPASPKKANGDVIVEWDNVSAGFDLTLCDLPGVYEDGYVWVGVSAQAVGVEGANTNIGLNQWDPERYGTLAIPDDGLSYDIVTQAAQVLRSGKVLGGYKPKHLILTGASQSGTRALAYANGVQPLHDAFDAIIPVINAGNAADFSPVPAHPNVSDVNVHSRSVTTKTRTDLKIPIFTLNSETESLFYFQNGLRQPNTHKFREWEVAGASHGNYPGALVTYAQEKADDLPVAMPQNVNISDVNWAPTLDAVYRHVSRWIRDPLYSPPVFPYLEAAKNASGVYDYVRDENGNVFGGIRLPEITVPVAGYNGNDNSIVGNTFPFSDEKLRKLYPTHAEYVAKIGAAAEWCLLEEVILDYQVKNYIQAAQAANVPPKATHS